MNKILTWVAIVAVAIIAVLGWFSPLATDVLGGDTNYDSIVLSDDLTVADDVIVGGTATSTINLNLFCIEVHPTSTATAVKITATTSNIGAGGTSPFVSAFGTCP